MAIVWKQIPQEEAEARTRAILEIITSELRRIRDDKDVVFDVASNGHATGVQGGAPTLVKQANAAIA